jgi:hypothetical protein
MPDLEGLITVMVSSKVRNWINYHTTLLQMIDSINVRHSFWGKISRDFRVIANGTAPHHCLASNVPHQAAV